MPAITPASGDYPPENNSTHPRPTAQITPARHCQRRRDGGQQQPVQALPAAVAQRIQHNDLLNEILSLNTAAKIHSRNALSLQGEAQTDAKSVHYGGNTEIAASSPPSAKSRRALVAKATWGMASSHGRRAHIRCHFGPGHSATITSRAINNAPTAAMVVDTSVASNACGNCGSANNACQCVNDKAGDISVSCRDQRCINHRHHRPQQKINAYRNGVAILVPAHLPNLRAVQPAPAADPAAFLIAMIRAARQAVFADREQKDRPRQRICFTQLRIG